MNEWIESRLDDAIFESALLPLLGRSLEKAFFGREEGQPHDGSFLGGILILHRHLGLILQNGESRRIYPKTIPGLSVEEMEAMVAATLPPSSRSSFTALCASTDLSISGGFPVLPDRISDAGSLFFWEGRFDWGKVVVLRTGRGDDMESYQAPFLKEGDDPDSFLRKILDAWMFDTTMEVFWGRILAHIPSEFLPADDGVSAQWRRRVFIPLGTETEREDRCVVAEYRRDFENGWRRSLRYEKKGGTITRPLAHRGGKEKSSALDVPVGFWGFLPLGVVRFPEGLVRKLDVSQFLGRLRWGRAMALRTLYRHLLYPGPLEILGAWVPENECFAPEVLRQLPLVLGESVLEDALVSLRVSSPGYRKSVEGRIRPEDMLVSETRHTSRLMLLLRSCPLEQAKSAVFSRLSSLEGVEPDTLDATLLRDHLAASGVGGHEPSPASAHASE
jgi:hypothetical protein